MNCAVCNKAPEWNDFPAPAGWKVSARGFSWESWLCEEHIPKPPRPPKTRNKPRAAGIITGEGHDHKWQRSILGETLPVVPQLSGRDIVWPEKWTRPWGKPGCRAPTVESLNDPGRRREFYKQNTRFQEM